MFLGYADGSLADAWSERWWHGRGTGDRVGRRDRRGIAGRARAARLARSSCRCPWMAIPTHAALKPLRAPRRGAESQGTRPALLGYLIHGGRRWPLNRWNPMASESPPEGCAGASSPGRLSCSTSERAAQGLPHRAVPDQARAVADLPLCGPATSPSRRPGDSRSAVDSPTRGPPAGAAQS